MKIIIVGFDNYDELNKVMNKLIEDSGCYLFNILCGGLSYSKELSIAEQWGKNNGAPVLHIYNSDIDLLMRELGKECDYLVIKITDRLPHIWKNFMMRHQAAGKHGTIVRG